MSKPTPETPTARGKDGCFATGKPTVYRPISCRIRPFVLAAQRQNHSVVNTLVAKRSQSPFENR